MNTLDEIRAEALRVYKDEKLADDFVNGFITKAASFLDNFNIHAPEGHKGDTRYEPTFGSSIAKGVAESTGRAVVGGAASLAVAGLGSIATAIRDHSLYNKFMTALNEVVRKNQVIRAAPRDKVMSFANTIFKFAPHVASDPNLLAHILANSIHGESVDTTSIKAITELEGRYRDLGSFEPKKWV